MFWVASSTLVSEFDVSTYLDGAYHIPKSISSLHGVLPPPMHAPRHVPILLDDGVLPPPIRAVA